jgi:hypothetical protein
MNSSRRLARFAILHTEFLKAPKQFPEIIHFVVFFESSFDFENKI